MRFRIAVFGLALQLVIPALTSALPPTSSSDWSPAGIATIHDTAYIESGDLLMMVNNQGSFAWDRTRHFGRYGGLHYPGKCSTTVMFASGIWIGAKVNNQVRLSAAEYSVDYRQGTIVSGSASPDDPRFKVYKIRKGDTRGSSPDFADWPFDDGAPAVKDHLGADSVGDQGYRIPFIAGDEAFWTVFNNADFSAWNSDPGSGGGGALGLEVQLYGYGFDSSGSLGRTFFLQYKLINKSGTTLDSVHVAFWADPDVGDAGDDLVGCDSILDLGYCYNAFAIDDVYLYNPPAIGFGLLNGPVVPSAGQIAWLPSSRSWIQGYRNLEMTAFSKYINGTDPQNASQSWNYMRGRNMDGTTIIDPVTDFPTVYMVSGNPVTQAGWVDMNPGDRRYMVTSGPFTMAPNDTQEVAIAVMVGSTYPFDCELTLWTDTILASHVAGTSGGRALALILHPDSTTGNEYRITFTGPAHDIRWRLWNWTSGLLLYPDQTNISGIGEYPRVDGLLVKVIGYPPGVGGWSVPNGTRRFTWAGMSLLPFEGFNGAIGWNSPCHFIGACDSQAVPASNLRRVLLRLAETGVDGSFDSDDSNVSMAYRYVRLCSNPPARPEFAPFIPNPSGGYGFQSFSKSVPLSAWDIDSDPPRRLVVGHLENNVAGGQVDGKYWPPYYGDADNSLTSGPREWLFIYDVTYSESFDPALGVDAIPNNLPIMYMSIASRRMDTEWLTGDEFLIIPVDSNLFFSEADTFSFTAPPPAMQTAASAQTLDNLASIVDLRHLDSVAQAKFEEIYMTCACPCLADPACVDGSVPAINVLDVSGFIDVAFRGVPATHDRPCPTERTDVNCDLVTDVRDAVAAIDVAFRQADPVALFCDPCIRP